MAVSKPDLFKPELKSVVWEHFRLSKEQKEKAFCIHCDNVFPYKSGNTSSLRKHIERRHNIRLSGETSCDSEGAASESGQLSIEASFKKSQMLKINDPKAQGIINRLGYMICSDLQPISVVGNRGFTELVRYLEPKFNMISRTYISQNTIPKLYNTAKDKLLELIKCAEVLSLTTDAWTSRSTQNYVTVTLHSITDKWQMQSFVLSTEEFSLAHTAGNLASHMDMVAKQWKLPDCCIWVTTDNASNITAGMKNISNVLRV